MEAALDEPQLQAFFTNQLQLQEGAFELIDPDEDKKLSDEEFAELWKWLSSRQGTRVMARWMTVARPWFYLLDTNGDLRLSAIEIGGAPDLLTTYDADADEQLTPNELPLLVKLELSRSDQRLDAGPLGMGAVETEAPVDADWFQAMDTNRDGYISESEFLGETEVFGGLDSDKDGFLSRNEVYDAPASY